MDEVLISIIVPIYNVEKYLDRCIKSILEQTYKNIEIILVDDGSLDNCPRMCDHYALMYNNIRVIHKENNGQSSARNRGIDEARGEFFSFVDPDDYIDRDMIKRLYYALIKYGADVTMVEYEEVNDKSRIDFVQKKEEILYEGKEIEKAFQELRIESVCIGLYDKKAIGRNRFAVGKTSEDILMNFEVFKKIEKFVFIPEKRYYYYYNALSSSNGCLDNKALNYIVVRRDIYSYYLKNMDKELSVLSEVLYARAAMGLLVRMALYGVASDIDKKQCKIELKTILKQHKKEYFRSKNVSFSRKILGFCCLRCFFVLRFIGLIKRSNING